MGGKLRLLTHSQSDVEKEHIIKAFRFELTKVQMVAIRQRMVAGLRNVSDELAQGVADGLGMTALPDPLPRALPRVPKAEVRESPPLSLFARPGLDGIMTRKIAILVTHGVDGEAAKAIHKLLAEQGAVPRFVGIKLGQVESTSGEPIDIEISMETGPSVVWDGLVVPTGERATQSLLESGHAMEFVKDHYRHCKTILVLGSAAALLEKAGIPPELPTGEPDPGLIKQGGDAVDEALRTFSEALTKHRHYDRETDPPRV